MDTTNAQRGTSYSNVLSGVLLGVVGAYLLYVGGVRFTQSPPRFDLLGLDAFLFVGGVMTLSGLFILATSRWD